MRAMSYKTTIMSTLFLLVYLACGGHVHAQMEPACPSNVTEAACDYGTHALGNIELKGITDFEISGRYAYIIQRTLRFTGLVVVDLNAPFRPTEVARLASPADTPFLSIRLTDRYAFVLPGPFSFSASRDSRGPLIIDIQDPSAPVIVAQVPTTGFSTTRNYLVHGGYLYLTDHTSFTRGLLEIFDLSDLSQIVTTASMVYPIRGGATTTLQIYRNHLYVTNGNSIQIFDVKDPVNPVRIRAITQIPNNFRILDGVGFGVNTLGQLVTFDLSDPATPAVIGTSFQSLNTSFFTRMHIELTPQHVFIATNNPRSVFVYNVSDLSAPNQTGRLGAFSSLNQKFKVVRDYAYLNQQDSIAIVDVSQFGTEAESPIPVNEIALIPPEPHVSNRRYFDNKGPIRLRTEESSLLVPHGTAIEREEFGVSIIDINEAGGLSFRQSSIPFANSRGSTLISERTSYIDNFMLAAKIFEDPLFQFADFVRIVISDISDPENPVILAQRAFDQQMPSTYLGGNRLVLAGRQETFDEDDFGFNNPLVRNVIDVFSVGSGNSLSLLGERIVLENRDEQVKNIQDSGHYLYTANDKQLTVYDLRASGTPVISQTITAPGSIGFVFSIDSEIFVSGDFLGVMVLDSNNNHSPIAFNADLFHVVDVQQIGDVLYIDDERIGVEKFALPGRAPLGTSNINLSNQNNLSEQTILNEVVANQLQFTQFDTNDAYTLGTIILPSQQTITPRTGYTLFGNKYYRLGRVGSIDNTVPVHWDMKIFDLTTRLNELTDIRDFYNTFTFTDSDGDGINDHIDNCIAITNPKQLNNDSDLQGDRCDSDDDNDLIPDYWETRTGTDRFRDDAHLNPDGDRRNNLEEYLFRTSPLIKQRYLEMVPVYPLILED